MHRKRRLLYTGLVEHFFFRMALLAAGVAILYSAVSKYGSSTEGLAAFFSLIPLAIGIGLLLEAKEYLRDLSLTGPSVAEGVLTELERTGDIDNSRYFVILEGGKRFQIGENKYRSLAAGDSVAVFSYPHTGVVTEIEKREKPRSQQANV